jgi:hypothetical protein
MSVDPETGIKPISEWGQECRRGLRIADNGTVISGAQSVRKISKGRKHRGMASDVFKNVPAMNQGPEKSK